MSEFQKVIRFSEPKPKDAPRTDLSVEFRGDEACAHTREGGMFVFRGKWRTLSVPQGQVEYVLEEPVQEKGKGK